MDRKPLSTIYSDIMKSLFCVVEADGTIKSLKGDVYTIGDKPLVIPTQELLKENVWDDKVPFHPLCEDLLAGQSDVTRWLIKRVNAAIALNVCHLTLCSLQIAQNQSLQGEIKDGSYTQFIEILGEAKESTVKFFGKLMKAYGDENGTISFSNLYVSRAGELDGKTFARIATLEIPMLSEDVSDASIQGIKANNKADKRMIVSFVEKLFEGVVMEVGANGNVPYFEAIMRLYYGVANRLNKVRKILKGGIDESTIGIVPLGWHKWLDEGMEDQLGVIPALPGNIGPVDKPKKPRNTVAKSDVEITSLTGRSSVAATSNDTPPWHDEEPTARDREVQPVVKSGGISVLNSGIRSRDDDRRDRDYDRRDDRRDSRRDDRDRGGRVSIFDRDYDSRRDDRRDDRRDRDRDYDRRDRRDRRDRDDRDDRRGGGISILSRR